MTSYQKHLMVYTGVLLVIFAVLGYYNLLKDVGVLEIMIGVVLGYVFCLIPDIDHPNSKIRHEIDMVLASLTVICIVLYVFFVKEIMMLYLAGLFAFIQIFLMQLKHRGLTHKLFFGAILSAPLFFVSYFIGGLAFIGFTSHLIAD